MQEYRTCYPGTDAQALAGLLHTIDARVPSGPGGLLIAMDGPCAAGKTTLSALLGRLYDCNVFSLDSFFLRPEQRTAARFAEPGGNIDYERAEEELLKPLRAGGAFSFRPYDCSRQELAVPRAVTPRAISVVEGVYSLHPRLAGYYDLKVFLDIDPETQARRLMARNPALYPRFVSEWLPLEAAYFETFRVADTCDVTLRCSGEDGT